MSAAVETDETEAASLVTLAMKFGGLAARTDQLCSAVDVLLENLGEVGIDCPKAVAKVREALEKARQAVSL